MKKAGRFTLNKDFIESEKAYQFFEQLKFTPLKCEYDYAHEIFFYTGYSHLFDIVEKGDALPFYLIEMEKDKNDDLKLSKIQKGE